MLWLAIVGCQWMPEVHAECTPLRLSPGRPECDGISLCIETTISHPVAAPEKVTTRTWFQGADGVGIEVPSAPRCVGCPAPTIEEMVCAAPEQLSRR